MRQSIIDILFGFLIGFAVGFYVCRWMSQWAKNKLQRQNDAWLRTQLSRKMKPGEILYIPDGTYTGGHKIYSNKTYSNGK
jgi:uncharacterized membrane protein required for colicin V production